MGGTKFARAGLTMLAGLLVMVLNVATAGAATFTFSTGSPDGKMALASRPDSAGKPEIEAADDFVLTTETAITHATFTGLLPTSGDVRAMDLEIYRVFPFDSNATRVPAVPTRVNSPSDVDFQARSSATPGQLSSSATVINSSFTAANSVLDGIHPAPNQTTGGEGAVTGQEVTFAVTLNAPFLLPPGHYFFVPQVDVSGPASSNFYWLSAPRPIVAPGTPFPAGTTDLQAWIRNSALQPDWLRAGTDIVGGTPAPAFNAAFTLNNNALPFRPFTHLLGSRIGVRLTVKLPGGGKVQVRDPQVGKRGKSGHTSAWFNSSTATAHAGAAHLTVVPNATGRKQLSRKHTIHVLVQVVVTPTGGRPAKRTISVTWHKSR
jgi:hypothetical protein